MQYNPNYTGNNPQTVQVDPKYTTQAGAWGSGTAVDAKYIHEENVGLTGLLACTSLRAKFDNVMLGSRCAKRIRTQGVHDLDGSVAVHWRFHGSV